MLVEQIMVKENIITLSPESTLSEILELEKKNQIRHFPVVSNGEVIGIVSDIDIRDARPSILDENPDSSILNTPVKQFMKQVNLITVHPLDFVEDAALKMYQYRIGFLPVMKDNQLVGILTRNDILQTLVEMMGVSTPSSRIEVELPDTPQGLFGIANVLLQCNAKVCSMLMLPSNTPLTRRISLRVKTIDPGKIIQHLKNNGYTVIDPPLE
ncbi:CBS and ACT domain-containing protein [Fodinisporobacter ferrooxydans]|uniref:CBS and ACT domain-containing protein n=1 Tax=Fodinisporobacter ferrooxydans TaxID=2901836 RepID=A0ABY4CNL1_9BACL|nr:CBS and ACT domain-containing protein [Alicyclobacillaceae bacterium MYW30-H2]